MRRSTAARALSSLARIARRYAPGTAQRKREQLDILARTKLGTAAQVRRLHELLLFLEAYPDDARVHARARRMLRAFGGRADLRRHRAALAGSGIAGTDTPYRYFWPTARWISRRWPGALALVRDDAEHDAAILAALPQLLESARAEWLRARPAPPGLDVIDRLRPAGTTDADFLVGLVERMPGDEFTREAWFDRLDPPLVLRAGRGTPQRTSARFDGLPCEWRPGGPRRGRPDLRAEARRPPLGTRELGRREAGALTRLARVCMVTRERDLAVFQYPQARDAFLIDDGSGLAFALLGIEPARRALLPATYGGLILQNRVPIGYVQVDVLGRHAALSFNLFETFRGGEGAWAFARFVAAVREVFGCDWFSIEPYQLGDGNDEGIETGAWWFYHRLGFRPRAADARRLATREAARRAANGRHRSPARTLRRLARHHLFFSLDPAEPAALPRIGPWLAAAVDLRRCPARGDDEARRRSLRERARRRLGAGAALRDGASGWLDRWAALALALTASGRCRRAERRALARFIVAKAGRSERDCQRIILRQRRLRSLLGC